MNQALELYALLNAASPELWESEYSRSTYVLETPERLAMLGENHALNDWLRLRACAGQPGSTLPSLEEARLAPVGTSAHAYQLLLGESNHGGPSKQETLYGPASLMAERLGDIEEECLQDENHALALWIRSRRCMALIAAGQAEEAWKVFERTPPEDRAEPEWQHFSEAFLPLRHRPDLLNHPVMSRAVAHQWSRVTASSIPNIASEAKIPSDGSALSYAELAQAVQAAGANQLTDWLTNLQIHTLKKHIEGLSRQEFLVRFSKLDAEEPTLDEALMDGERDTIRMFMEVFSQLAIWYASQEFGVLNATVLDQALRITPPNDYLWLRIAAKRSDHYLITKDYEKAAAFGTRALEKYEADPTLRPQLRRTERIAFAHLHLKIATALDLTGNDHKAAILQHCEAALDAARGLSVDHETLARFAIARAAVERGDHSDLDEHIDYLKTIQTDTEFLKERQIQSFLLNVELLATLPPERRGGHCVRVTYDPDAISDQALHEGLKQHRPGAPSAIPGISDLMYLLLLAVKVRRGKADLAELKQATEERLQAFDTSTAGTLKAMFLRGVAELWAPDNHREDPVCDYQLAERLLREALQLEGGESQASSDLRGFLGRVLVRTPLAGTETLKEAKCLLLSVLGEQRAAGKGYRAANTACLLADLECQIGRGGALERLQQAAQLLKESLKESGILSATKAENTAYLAWIQTQIGFHTHGSERRQVFQDALKLFAQVDQRQLASWKLRGFEHNRSICEAQLVGDPEQASAMWRACLEKLQPTDAQLFATTLHNLANSMLSEEQPRRETYQEALRFSLLAAEARSYLGNHRAYFESAHLVSSALFNFLTSYGNRTDPETEKRLFLQAEFYAHQAAHSARQLGEGQELQEAGVALTRLALLVPEAVQVQAFADEGWKVIREAAPYLVHSEANPEREATMAAAMARNLASLLAQESDAVAQDGSLHLTEAAAQHVERWIVRSQQPARRRLEARLARPFSVPSPVWDEFQVALRTDDQALVLESLDAVRRFEPNFLAEESANDCAWQWLRDHPGSAAISTMLSGSGVLVTCLSFKKDGTRQRDIFGLPIPAPPYAFEEFSSAFGSNVPDISTLQMHDALAGWLRENVINPVHERLGGRLTTVLWNPDPQLRLLSPSALWGTVPVASTTSFVLTDATAYRERSNSTLLVMADPDPSDEQHLGIAGTETIERLAQAASELGAVEMLASRGALRGTDIFGGSWKVLPEHATPQAILREAEKHQVIVLLAHGESPEADSARILCFDAAGEAVYLDLAALQQSPDAFTGATVLLLSCATGRMNASYTDPRGIAGTMLSAGAKAVVAPLWPVRLDHAERVATRVLQGLQRGEAPWQTLAETMEPATATSATLGPEPSPRAKRAQAATQQLAFVTWIG